MNDLLICDVFCLQANVRFRSAVDSRSGRHFGNTDLWPSARIDKRLKHRKWRQSWSIGVNTQTTFGCHWNDRRRPGDKAGFLQIHLSRSSIGVTNEGQPISIPEPWLRHCRTTNLAIIFHIKRPTLKSVGIYKGLKTKVRQTIENFCDLLFVWSTFFHEISATRTLTVYKHIANVE